MTRELMAKLSVGGSLWGAGQGIAFGCGGLIGGAASDIARHLVSAPGTAYATVFLGQAALFIVATVLATRLAPSGSKAIPRPDLPAGTFATAGKR